MIDIKAGEELTIRYGNDLFRFLPNRAAVLKEVYGFDCDCKICDETSQISQENRTVSQQLRKLVKSHGEHSLARDMSPQKLDELELGICKLITDNATGMIKTKK